MNSLTYLSRQFDVLASPRTPPSTPTTESIPLLSDNTQHSGTPLKRVQTWSTKSFLFPSNPPPTSSSLKRSLSSPGDVFPSPPGPSTSTRPLPPSLSQRRHPPPSKRPSLPPPPRRPSVSALDKPPRPKPSSESPSSLLRRIFFVNVILSLSNYLYTLWRSLIRHPPTVIPHQQPQEESTDDDGKDSEDDSKEEQTQNQTVSILLQPTHPSPPNLSPQSSHPILNPVTQADPSIPPPPLLDIAFVIEPYSSFSIASSLHPPQESSRTPTPTLAARKSSLHRQKKTLVLDLDETLIHSTSRPLFHSSGGILGNFGIGRRNKGGGHTVEVVLGGKSTLYHVYKRPFVDYFLRKVSAWYTLVIFTASMQEYADPVIDWLDAGRGILARRFFRESCTQLPNGAYTKDLSIVEQDLSLVCLVDNSPICYTINEANGIPIEGWTHDPHDEALLDLLPVLDSLRFTSDVRRVLGIRGFS